MLPVPMAQRERSKPSLADPWRARPMDRRPASEFRISRLIKRPESGAVSGSTARNFSASEGRRCALQLRNIVQKSRFQREDSAGLTSCISARFARFYRDDRGLVMLWASEETDNRPSISRTDLQSAITEAVKKFDPECKDFIDVIIEHTKPDAQFGANWAIRGIKFGRSDRQKAAQAIAVIVARMQHEFRLSEESREPPRANN